MQKTDFLDLVQKVESNAYLLPDFQRGFVWTDENQQKRIVASVLAKMPIGSILLLEADAKDYACKYIGCHKKVDTSSINEKVHFLLDGQQRITVLTNVFSNVIQNNAGKVTELASRSLKRRFFLKIPKWDSLNDGSSVYDDIFGVKRLVFPYKNPGNAIPDFLSSDIESYIECYTYNSGDDKPYNPKNKLTPNLDKFCINVDDGYLIPLFLMIPTGDRTLTSQMELRYADIIDAVANQIKKDIMSHYTGLPNRDAKLGFCKDFLESEDVDMYVDDMGAFDDILSSRAKVWKGNLDKYLNSCLKETLLYKVVVSEQERKRAIDIYENLNRGGVSLNTFDLLMARVAIVNPNPFMDRIYSYIDGSKAYNASLIDDIAIRAAFSGLKSYNASQFAKVYSGNDKELASSYIDCFLDVLSLVCNVNKYNPDEYKVDFTKKDKILSLEPTLIDTNAKKVCEALDRALFFFETRCGIRKIKDINNALMLVVIAVIFSNDIWYADVKVHSLLEAWYWAAVFSGEFDKDQNVIMIKSITKLIKTINGNMAADWIKTMRDNILNANNFSDKDLLLMKKTSEDRVPKVFLRDTICQYWLSRSYTDMFDSKKKVSVFYEDADNLEAHHIVPLGTAANYGESTKKLRTDKTHLLNSPVNFILITKEANKTISDDAPGTYFKNVLGTAKSDLHLSTYTASTDPLGYLENRFDETKSVIVSEVDNLISAFVAQRVVTQDD